MGGGGFDDGADERGQGVDLLVHGRVCGHGGSFLFDIFLLSNVFSKVDS